MFTYVEEEIQTLGYQLDPQAVMADFELALVQSLELQFPRAAIQGCFFHFSQCLWRKVHAVARPRKYKNDPDTQSFIQKTNTLAFVPLSFVCIAWDAIKADAPPLPEVDDFNTYVESTWLNGNFLPHTWKYHCHDGPRTNNHLEGWHNRLKRISRIAHPNIFELVEILKKGQAAMEVSIEQLARGGRVRAKRRKVVGHEETIKRIMHSRIHLWQ